VHVRGYPPSLSLQRDYSAWRRRRTGSSPTATGCGPASRGAGCRAALTGACQAAMGGSAAGAASPVP
jgi:hypothetical protein